MCISGQFQELIKVNKICRSPWKKGNNWTTEKENTNMEQLILSNSGYMTMFRTVRFELGIQRSTKVNSYLRVVCLQNNKCCLTFLNTQDQNKTVKPPMGWELLNTFCKKNKALSCIENQKQKPGLYFKTRRPKSVNSVFVLDQWVFVLDHRAFVLDYRVFI